jgi:hypothetical protein
MKAHFYNYKIIEDFDLHIDGITLIRGQNDSGKTTVMRGFRTVVRNASDEDCIRHGARGFRIDLEIPTAEKVRKLTYSRASKAPGPILKLDDKDPIDKLGRLSLSDIDPTFPLKVLTFGDDKFMPQFVFQKQVPVFGQVDIYSFFSSMFESVAVLSKHNLKVRARVSEATGNANALKAKTDNLLEMSNVAEASLAQVDQAQVFLRFSSLESAISTSALLSEAMTQAAQAAAQRDSLMKYRQLASVDFEAMAVIIDQVTEAQRLYTSLGECYSEMEELSHKVRIAKDAEYALMDAKTDINLLATATEIGRAHV